MTTATLARRLDKLEQSHHKADRVHVIIYDPEAEGEKPEESSGDEGGISIYMPDNGRED